MRGRICAISLLGLVAACSASAQTPLDKPAKASAGKLKPASASAGASSAPTSPEDASADHQRSLDERRATESKRKMRKRPGYQEEVPTPRA
ncbi:MAG TPA: hypothetical protein VG873_05370 [Burkholderiales bacterium]|nr:hypothetical protein [Burkholderiales bacterium]